MAIIERCLQGCLDKLVTCVVETGFKFSPTKNCVSILPTKMAYSLSLDSNYMDNSFLLKRRSICLFFDRKLNFKGLGWWPDNLTEDLSNSNWIMAFRKSNANPENPAYSCVVNPEFKRLFRSKPRTISTSVIRLHPHLEDMEVDHDAISDVRPPECSPWFLDILIYFLTSQISGRETPVPLSSRACCLSNFVDFRCTGRCIRPDQRKTSGHVLCLWWSCT